MSLSPPPLCFMKLLASVMPAQLVPESREKRENK